MRLEPERFPDPARDFDNPVPAAIDARDQCVASLGWRSRVATITSSTASSEMVRGAPGRGSSASPSRHDSTNRRRHTPTVWGHTPTSAATSLLDFPAAQPNTIRHRCANDCDDFARRAHRCNVSRSSSVNTNSATGLPLLATQPSPELIIKFMAQDTSVFGARFELVAPGPSYIGPNVIRPQPTRRICLRVPLSTDWPGASYVHDQHCTKWERRPPNRLGRIACARPTDLPATAQIGGQVPQVAKVTRVG
jgi:hypothetical protein